MITSAATNRRTDFSPKNGKRLVCLVAGATDQTFRQIQQGLRKEWVAEARYHWDRNKDFKKDIPKDVDLVIVVTNAIPHKHCDSIMDRAKRSQTPVLSSARQMSVLAPMLDAFGVPRVPPPAQFTATEKEPRVVFDEKHWPPPPPRPPEASRVVSDTYPPVNPEPEPAPLPDLPELPEAEEVVEWPEGESLIAALVEALKKKGLKGISIDITPDGPEVEVE